jgi:hypothetical protein
MCQVACVEGFGSPRRPNVLLQEANVDLKGHDVIIYA